ncbi:hypothetical protein ACFRJ8_15345 [Arthrobacter sp. NPDC056886]|uniref:hypothetical protein n=1 Tax=Arthrobacter sp. NPDC056886 TaxID=3345960 RepID=UPI003671C3C8
MTPTITTPATLATVVASPPSGRPKAVLFDHHEYANSVILRGGDVPWDNATAYSAFFAQAQGLLRPDVALLDLKRLYDHLTAGNTRLETAMGGKSRTGYALRTLLADDDTNKAVLEFATVFAQTARQPVVLRIPSPMEWLIATHRLGGAANLSDLDADDAENASMYVSDWLRAFAALPVGGLLLDDRSDQDRPRVPVGLEAYTPIANVTNNYRWTLGQLDDAQVRLHADTAVGGYIPASFWLDSKVELPSADFYLAEIPSAARPEDVLVRLEALT